MTASQTWAIALNKAGLCHEEILASFALPFDADATDERTQTVLALSGSSDLRTVRPGSCTKEAIVSAFCNCLGSNVPRAVELWALFNISEYDADLVTPGDRAAALLPGWQGRLSGLDLDVFQDVVVRLKLTRHEVSQNNYEFFASVVRSNTIEAVAFLWKQVRLCPDAILAKSCVALRAACTAGKSDVVVWLVGILKAAPGGIDYETFMELRRMQCATRLLGRADTALVLQQSAGIIYPL
jgi:hypothetical protein